jgi:hypothetical protein
MAWCLTNTGTTLRSPLFPMTPPKHWAVTGYIVTRNCRWQCSPVWTMDFLGRFSQICPFLRIRPSGFHFSGFRNNNFLHSKVVSLASNPPTWRNRPLCGLVIPPGTGFPFRRLLRLSGLRRRHSNPSSHRDVTCYFFPLPSNTKLKDHSLSALFNTLSLPPCVEDAPWFGDKGPTQHGSSGTYAPS